MINVNGTYYIAGSTINAIGKEVSECSTCLDFMSEDNLPNSDFINKA